MDDAMARGSAMVHGDLRHDNLVHNRAEENIKQAVIVAYTKALKGLEVKRHHAFNAALRVYRMHHPGISEGVARLGVAQIICFADGYRPE
jgi:hypothetical protein